MNLTIGFHKNSNKNQNREEKNVAEKQKALPQLLTLGYSFTEFNHFPEIFMFPDE